MTESKKITSDFGISTGLIYLYFTLCIYAVLSLCGVPFNKLFTSNKEDAISNTSNSSKANTSTNSTTDHKLNPVYQQGHKVGVMAKALNDNSGCSNEKAQEQGACVDQISKDLWCEGYNDGYSGR